MSQTRNLDLLLKEIEDAYVQENFYRLKLYLEYLDKNQSITINPPGGGSDCVCVWEKFTRSVPASSTVIVDSLPMSSFDKLEYTMNFENTLTNRSKGLKVSVVKDDTLIKEQVYAITGAPLSTGLATVVNGSDYELHITNNETVTIGVSFARLTLP